MHTLANYLRQTGAEVVTLRAAFPPTRSTTSPPHLAVLSPGPGTPSDFDVSGTLRALRATRHPRLRRLPRPAGHGRALRRHARRARPADARQGLAHPRARRAPVRGTADRVHRRTLPLAVRDPRRLPAELRVTAETEDGVVMAVEHATLPLAAVQFHPESILTLDDDVGLRLLQNVMTRLATSP